MLCDDAVFKVSVEIFFNSRDKQKFVKKEALKNEIENEQEVYDFLSSFGT